MRQQVLESLPPMEKTQIELQTPGFGLAQPRLLQAEPVDESRLFTSVPLSALMSFK